MIKYDYIYDFNKDGFAIVKKGNKRGVINRQGEEIVSPIYDNVWGFEGNNFATVTKDRKMGLINKKGEIVVPLKYDYIHYFEKGIIEVTQGIKDGFIDKEGNFYPLIKGKKLRKENNELYYAKMKDNIIFRIGGFTGFEKEFIKLLRSQLRGNDREIKDYINYINDIKFKV